MVYLAEGVGRLHVGSSELWCRCCRTALVPQFTRRRVGSGSGVDTRHLLSLHRNSLMPLFEQLYTSRRVAIDCV